MGSSIAEYILKCRLDHALAEIACSRKAIDVVLEYGFMQHLSGTQTRKKKKNFERFWKTGILKKICLLVMFIFRTVQKSQETSGQ